MKSLLVLLVTSVLLAATLQSDFLTDQKRYKRVRIAIEQKNESLKSQLKKKGLTLGDFHLLLVVYKESDELELYVKQKTSEEFELLKTYEICAKSGNLGPKRKQGDLQVPEGFYYIDRFNPYSNFYLSLGINYPNASDRIMSNASNLGGDIFIHGDCVTIGCLPMTTDKIKEIYMYAVYARNNGQNKIPVYIFPFRMNKGNNELYFTKYIKNQRLINFWMNLKEGYELFSKNKEQLEYSVGKNGSYLF